MRSSFDKSSEKKPASLLCIWHILRNWERHESYKSLPKSLKDYIMKSLRTILHTLDRDNVIHVRLFLHNCDISLLY